ncbi:cupin-like domain-containing protein [Paraglaciecola sp. L3A3]|uniref:cupin-like domain-containing protein n=1 Tax=Paraglaciecola sp. L3A3 TaxID=2686358 RepID=UPI00131D6A0E|nr:cupin-like domain-containing protein [Paraglaciecola sp. L3A3]
MQKVKEYNISAANVSLENIIKNSHQPVVFKGLVSDWQSVKEARKSNECLNKYLTQLSSKPSNRIEAYEATEESNGRYFFGNSFDEFNFNKVAYSFTDFLQKIQYISQQNSNKTSIYAGGKQLSKHLDNFARDNALSYDFGRPVEPRVWLGNSSVISTHFDTTDNIACLVSGKRTFTLFPTEQVKNLYPAPFNHTIAGAAVSMVDICNPDFEQHPLYQEALDNAFVAELEPGDAIYIPLLWWHNVRSEGDLCMLVNYFWTADTRKLESPMNFLYHGLYTLSHLSPEEILSWKALIDHFVFKTNGEPMTHLPTNNQGIFGEITAEHAYDIRDLVLREMGFDLEFVKKGKYSTPSSAST